MRRILKSERRGMKTPVSVPFDRVRHLRAGALVCTVAISLLVAVHGAESQPSGYLTKSGHPGLRFAPPPKTPVISLGPQPTSYVPPPVFVKEFVEPTTTNLLPVSPTNLMTPISAAPGSPMTEAPNAPPANRVSAPQIAAELNSLTPQALVKYFAEPKTNRVEVSLSEPVGFQLPIRDAKPRK